MADISPLRAIGKLWLDDSDVAGLIGTRLSAAFPPEKTAKPYGVVRTVGDVEDYTMDGSAGISKGRVTALWVASSRQVVEQLAEFARLAATGTRATVTLGGDTFTFKFCHLEDMRDADEAIGAASDEVDFAIEQDWWIARAVSTS